MRIARLNRPRTFSIDAAASCRILLYSVHSAGLNNVKCFPEISLRSDPATSPRTLFVLARISPAQLPRICRGGSSSAGAIWKHNLVISEGIRMRHGAITNCDMHMMTAYLCNM